MDLTTLLQWHYMIFLLPFGISAVLMLLSSLHLGGHHHGGPGHLPAHGHALPHGLHGGHGHVPGHAGHPALHGAAGGHSHPHPAAPAHGTGQAHTSSTSQQGEDTPPAPARTLHAAPLAGVLGFLGIGRAPLPMVIGAAGMAWGFCGYWANRLLVPAPAPSLVQMLPSVGIALAGGVLGARGASALISRLLPPDETSAVSRDTLFGLVGTITFPASATAGRIHIYDEFGSLHDETCRVTPGHPAIEKGRKVLVMDVDRQGHLIVEEIPDSVR